MQDLNNKKFDRWTVIEYLKTVNRNAIWLCRCDCGTIGEISCHQLKRGGSRSCGCLQRETASNRYINLIGNKITCIRKSEQTK